MNKEANAYKLLKKKAMNKIKIQKYSQVKKYKK